MDPITQRLRVIFPELPQPCANSTRAWTFAASLKELKPAVYEGLLGRHPILNVELSILCTELREDFLFPEKVSKVQVQARLINALMLCELLEHLNQHYLIVPREVMRLRKLQAQLRSILTELAEVQFRPRAEDEMELGLSFMQQVRDLTMQMNVVRIGVNRTKRLINLLNEVIKNAPFFREFVTHLDSYANPILAYFGLFFHIPRLISNFGVLLKHCIPGPWMSETEASMGWSTRLTTQVQRRWFDMGNDAVWTMVSAFSMFVFVGAAAGGAVYFSTAAFAFDVMNAAARAYIELKRLYALHQEYELLLAQATTPARRAYLENHLQFIERRIEFEHWRFLLHVSNMTLVFAAMILVLPSLTISAPALLVSAAFLLLLWATAYELTQRLELYRPKETIEVPTKLSPLSFFAPSKSKLQTEERPKPACDEDCEDLTQDPSLFI